MPSLFPLSQLTALWKLSLLDFIHTYIYLCINIYVYNTGCKMLGKNPNKLFGQPNISWLVNILIKTIKYLTRGLQSILALSKHDTTLHSNPASSILQMRKTKLRTVKQGARESSHLSLSQELVLFSHLSLTQELVLFPVSHIIS